MLGRRLRRRRDVLDVAVRLNGVIFRVLEEIRHGGEDEGGDEPVRCWLVPVVR